MRNLIKLLVRFAVTLGLLVWVISRVDVRGFCETVKQARLGFLAAVWTIAVGVLWFESVKMRLILTQQGCDLKTGNVFGASAVCSLYSMVMPGSLSTGVKWYILKGNTGKGSNVFSSMMYNQLTEMAIVVVLGLGAFIVRNPLNRWQIQAVSAGLLLLVSAGYLLFLFSDRGVRINRFLRKILRVFPGRIRKAGEKVFTQIETFQRLGWRFHLTVLILTAISFVVRGCGIYFFASVAANISVPPAVLVWQYSFIYILGRLPISIANLGVREAVLVTGLGVYGVQPQSAVLMSMIIFSNLLLMACIGAVWQIVGVVGSKSK